MKFDYDKTMKYAIEIGEKENECTYEYLYALSRTIGFAFWNLRNEIKQFSQPFIDVCNKIYSFFPESNYFRIAKEFERQKENTINAEIPADYNKILEEKRKERSDAKDKFIKEKYGL